MRRMVIWLSRRVFVSHAKSFGFWGSILSTTEKEKWGRGEKGGKYPSLIDNRVWLCLEQWFSTCGL